MPVDASVLAVYRTLVESAEATASGAAEGAGCQTVVMPISSARTSYEGTLISVRHVLTITLQTPCCITNPAVSAALQVLGPPNPTPGAVVTATPVSEPEFDPIPETVRKHEHGDTSTNKPTTHTYVAETTHKH